MAYPAKTERNRKVMDLHAKGLSTRQIGKLVDPPITGERVRQIIIQEKKRGAKIG